MNTKLFFCPLKGMMLRHVWQIRQHLNVAQVGQSLKERLREKLSTENREERHFLLFRNFDHQLCNK